MQGSCRRFTLRAHIHPRDPNVREGRTHLPRLTSTTENAALEFGRRAKGRSATCDQIRKLFQFSICPRSFVHDPAPGLSTRNQFQKYRFVPLSGSRHFSVLDDKPQSF
jgi:hypothetical protein